MVFVPKMTQQEIPDGAYKGAVIQAASGGTAIASDILSGKTATVDSGLISGAMANRGQLIVMPSMISEQNFLDGYYEGITVKANRIVSETTTATYNASAQTMTIAVTLGWRPHKVYITYFVIAGSSATHIFTSIANGTQFEYHTLSGSAIYGGATFNISMSATGFSMTASSLSAIGTAPSTRTVNYTAIE